MSLVSIFLISCVSENRLAYTANESALAQSPGFSNIRFWADETQRKLEANQATYLWSSSKGKSSIKTLALSGGGSAGAFGAGFLAGWSTRGDRPKFDVVTGVSAGALIAPFAFLGPDYDGDLGILFVSGLAEKLAKARNPFAGLFGQSLFDGEPLKELVAKHVDELMLDKIATEHRKGRRLFVVTTNLDVQRAVVWDMGAIAASPSYDSLGLFREVLVASSSIPGVYPAVPIQVVANGKVFSELHSDGGVWTQVFVAPEAFITAEKKHSHPAARSDLYVIINNNTKPEFSLTENSTLAVSARAYSTFIKSHASSTINSAFLYAKNSNTNFYLTSIDESVPYKMSDPFNTQYMRRMYSIGYQKGVNKEFKREPS